VIRVELPQALAASLHRRSGFLRSGNAGQDLLADLLISDSGFEGGHDVLDVRASRGVLGSVRHHQGIQQRPRTLL
jgi:hypothetical protein